MSRDNLDVVNRLYDAWNRRDPDCEPFFDVDVEGSDLQRAPGAPPAVRGIKTVKQGWLKWLLRVGDVSAELEDYVEVDDWVICITHWHGSRAPTGTSVDLRSVEALQVRDGKIRRAVHGYESREQALEAVLRDMRPRPKPASRGSAIAGDAERTRG